MMLFALQEQLDKTEARLKQRERQLDAIHRVNEALFLRNSVDELVRVALTEAVAVADADVGSFQLYNSQDDTLVFKHVLDPAATYLIGSSTPASQGYLRAGFSQRCRAFNFPYQRRSRVQ